MMLGAIKKNGKQITPGTWCRRLTEIDWLRWGSQTSWRLGQNLIEVRNKPCRGLEKESFRQRGMLVFYSLNSTCL